MKRIYDLNSGYIGNTQKWNDFFRAFINSEKFLELILPFDKTIFEISDFQKKLEIIINEPLIEENIKLNQKQRELKVSLPKSYTDFVNANGIAFFNEIRIITQTFEPLLQVEKINYYSKYAPKHFLYFINGLNYSENIIVRENYYSYNNFTKNISEYNGLSSNPRLLKLNLGLGELSFGFLEDKKNSYSRAIILDESSYATSLLLPNERTLDGEMEAWMLDSEDIIRFRSFAEFFMSNLFFKHEIPTNMSIEEYLNLYGVNNILDFDILRETAIP